MAQTRQEFLTREEVAKFSRYSVPGFRKLERKGLGPPMLRVNRRPLYHIDGVRKWLLSRVETRNDQVEAHVI